MYKLRPHKELSKSEGPQIVQIGWTKQIGKQYLGQGESVPSKVGNMGESMDKLKPNTDINLVSTNMHNIK
jgi:hypothetical protein